ncbi:MAG: trimeric intracellular cation channel family protein [Lentisphaeria bacterium]
MFYFFDIIGTSAFAIAGVMASRRFRPDFIGALILAFATAIGGGIIRDSIINRPSIAFQDANNFYIIVISTFVAIFWADHIERTGQVLNIADAIGLGFFNSAGVMAGLHHNIPMPFVIILGAMTGCGGGIIRDVLCAQMPTCLLPKEIYISACIVGSTIGLLAYSLGMPTQATSILIVIITVTIRILAIAFHWKMPAITKK